MILMACVDGRNGMALQLPPAEPGPGGAGGPAGRGRGGPPLGEWGHGPPVPGGGAEPPLCGRVVFGKGGAGGALLCGGPLCGALCRACGAGGAVPLGPGPIRRTFTGTCPWRAGLWPGGRSSPASPTRSLQRKSISHESNPHFPDGGAAVLVPAPLRLHDAPGGGHRHLLFSGGYPRLVREPYVAVDGNQRIFRRRT